MGETGVGEMGVGETGVGETEFTKKKCEVVFVKLVYDPDPLKDTFDTDQVKGNSMAL